MLKNIILFTSIIFLAGCGAERIDALEKSLKKVNKDISDIRSLQAEQTSTLNQVRQEMRELRGKTDEIQHVSVGKTQQLEQTISQLKSRVPPPAGVPADLLDQDDQAISKINSEAAKQFRSGLEAIRTGDFETGTKLFESFYRENQGTAFSDNALFWMGICASQLGRGDLALGNFSDVFQKYPAEDMVPAALWFLALELEKGGSKSDAKLTLEKLIDEHPNSEFAIKARGKVGVSEKAPTRRVVKGSIQQR